MKEFFKYVLATVVGIITVSIIGMILFGMVIGALIASTEKQVSVENNSMLLLELDRQIVDRAPNDPFEDLDILGFNQVKTLGLDDIFTSLENAATDDRIKGVYLKLSMVNGGMASVAGTASNGRNYTSRLCSTAASMNEANRGCGSKGRDFSSGWNWTPTNQG